MKKALLALLLAIVMITNFSMALAVMAHDAEEVSVPTRVVCPRCYGTQTTTYCSTGLYYEETNAEQCQIHGNFCWIITYKDARVTACRDCGEILSYYIHSHTYHTMES